MQTSAAVSLKKQVYEILNALLKVKDIDDISTDIFRTKNYERAFFDFVNGKVVTTNGNKRYCDGILGNIKVELKKSASVTKKGGYYWLDQVRYAECFMSRNDKNFKLDFPKQARESTVTIFIECPTGIGITKLLIVDSYDLCGKMYMNKVNATQIIERYYQLREGGHGNNNQVGFYSRDLKDIALEIDLENQLVN